MRRYATQPGGINSQAAFCALVEADASPSQKPSRDVVPIGSVEWTWEYAGSLGIKLEPIPTYPAELKRFLCRDIRPGFFRDARDGEFVKPIFLKAFTGALRSAVDEAVDPLEGVWISDPVEFVAEWRCYILNNKLVGTARYDDNDEDASPDLSVVNDMLNAWTGPAGYSLDIGLLADGRTALVEFNDGWALGYYPDGDCRRQDYLNVITARWDELATGSKEKP